ncbi:thiosulfate sulfurtransferase [Vibrio sp. UCD-FRSSP16_10]|uniref:thiosulfate sulfurtransferase GlpE n=1 Tax=unclassified Vibrio TaxID=2614977 RepID=UPI000801658E|nr:MULTISPECIES: thiosulfate sulfurtransferase GlpE [unclassified Vibrio]OBT12943.1 thiosulfate sulfurtransferase [Vibrio sp. UCD-FRSSP16_30]OBT19188.1 thiosulfate sulfurtransferase [Vibrio sp. UCD-FRSSP16_10]
MEEIQRVSVSQAHQMLQSEQARLVDIRDIQAFTLAHPVDAFHLTNQTIADFMDSVEFEDPILVICYHGISSVGAAEYLANQGFEQVFSIDGGFEAWQRQQLPIEVYE